MVGERHDPASQAALARALEQQYRKVDYYVAGMRTTAVQRSVLADNFDVIVVFLLVMAVLLAVVGGLGLMGTMSINVIERTREIGVMRAIGATDGVILQVVMVEGILIGLVSWVFGSLLALPLSQVLSDAVGEAFIRSPLSYTFSKYGSALWLALVIGLAALASFPPAWRASRLTVRDVLAYE